MMLFMMGVVLIGSIHFDDADVVIFIRALSTLSLLPIFPRRASPAREVYNE
jgi:hypothetical protein